MPSSTTILIIQTLVGIGVIWGTLRNTVGGLREDLTSMKEELKTGLRDLSSISASLAAIITKTSYAGEALADQSKWISELDARLRHLEVEVARLSASKKEE